VRNFTFTSGTRKGTLMRRPWTTRAELRERLEAVEAVVEQRGHTLDRLESAITGAGAVMSAALPEADSDRDTPGTD
jgi:hypothetical protein